MGIEMLHDDKGHPGTRRQLTQEFHRRFKSAGRTADAYNWATSIPAFAGTLVVRTLRPSATLGSLFMRCSVF
jgi:hypothetical protein